jgi:hypothetical protein
VQFHAVQTGKLFITYYRFGVAIGLAYQVEETIGRNFARVAARREIWPFAGHRAAGDRRAPEVAQGGRKINGPPSHEQEIQPATADAAEFAGKTIRQRNSLAAIM